MSNYNKFVLKIVRLHNRLSGRLVPVLWALPSRPQVRSINNAIFFRLASKIGLPEFGK